MSSVPATVQATGVSKHNHNNYTCNVHVTVQALEL